MSPVNVSAIGAYIREQREQARISLRQLAQSAGISNPYLSQIERGLRRPSADILQQIAKGLRVSAEALYVQAGFLEDRAPGSVVREAVLTDSELTERQKQVLIEIYESFRKETSLARADVAEVEDDPDGLLPDEAALTWPENLTPAAVSGRPRRLGIAPSFRGSADEAADDADGDDEDQDDEDQDDEDQDDEDQDDRDQDRADGERGQKVAQDEAERDRRGGTIHQFPPPSGTR